MKNSVVNVLLLWLASMSMPSLVMASSPSTAMEDFVRDMEGAIAEEKRQDRLTARLWKMAKPLDDSRQLEEYQDFAINITQYAFKYIGCQNVHQFSDDLAQGEYSTTVMGMNRFVIFRLCPKSTCSNYYPKGCMSGYGDYVLPMEDYLQTINNNNKNDDYYYANANYYNDDGNADECENYYQPCKNYRTACKDYSQYAVDMQAYFQCSQFNVGNSAGYMGPHCRSDGVTIGIGLYKDQYCNQYNSDVTDLSTIFGTDLGDQNLKAYYSNKCISCKATDGYSLDADNENQVTPVCGALYDLSAKCNQYMGYQEGYADYNQEETSDEVCSFIDSLVSKTYDEYGEIMTKATFSDFIDINSYEKSLKYGMAASIILVASLLLYSCYLHRVISTSKYSWYPKGRRGYSTNVSPGDAEPMARLHSGIIQGRSRSGQSMELKNGGTYA
eukprot:Nitzschia sp. Nitz4//scaffold9_size221794//43573//45376//NITZ4_001327-RA/size221794-augustus-gene-0.159-mRNA-1//-1//CDS//3329560944//9014//frame0